MAHFALLDENNIVVLVTVGRDEDDGKEDELSARTGQTYKQTSYNTCGGVYMTPGVGTPDPDQSKAFRKNYAGIGFEYREDIDAFVPPQPFPSWVLNLDTGLWDAPVSRPEGDSLYYWNEDNQEWVASTFP